jgi:hypothetical protein
MPFRPFLFARNVPRFSIFDFAAIHVLSARMKEMRLYAWEIIAWCDWQRQKWTCLS